MLNEAQVTSVRCLNYKKSIEPYYHLKVNVAEFLQNQLSHDMRFPTMWYVRSAKAHTSLSICGVGGGGLKCILLVLNLRDCFCCVSNIQNYVAHLEASWLMQCIITGKQSN